MTTTDTTPATDPEGITVETIERYAATRITVDGNVVTVTCSDDQMASELRTSFGMILADRIAGWRRVAAEVPSQEERVARLGAKFASASRPPKETDDPDVA